MSNSEDFRTGVSLTFNEWMQWIKIQKTVDSINQMYSGIFKNTHKADPSGRITLAGFYASKKK
jgi:hypothetical protein